MPAITYRLACTIPRNSLRSGEIGLAVADLVVAGRDFDFDGAVGVGGTARIGIVGKTILGTELPVDAIEDGGEFRQRIRIKHSATGRVGHGFEGMFAGGVASILVFHRANNDRVKEHTGADSLPARGVEVVMAGSFSSVGDENDHAAPVISALGERARGQKHRIVDRSARAIGNPADGVLKGCDIVGETRALRNILIEGKDSQAIPGPDDLADEMGRRFLLKADFFVRAEARVNHQCQVKWQRGFRLEDRDFLLLAFVEELESFARQIRGRPIAFVENADEHADKIDINADATALGRGILGVFLRRWRRRLYNFAGFADRRGFRSVRTGVRGRSGIRFGLGFLGPGRTIGVFLTEGVSAWQ